MGWRGVSVDLLIGKTGYPGLCVRNGRDRVVCGHFVLGPGGVWSLCVGAGWCLVTVCWGRVVCGHCVLGPGGVWPLCVGAGWWVATVCRGRVVCGHCV